MILTEAEAKTKWCPMVRLGYSEFSNWNRIYQGKKIESSTTCIASECMMWRLLDNHKGFCGLAGTPA